MTDDMQNNPTEVIFTDKPVMENAGYPDSKPHGNLLTVIPGVIICILTAGFVFLLAIGSDLLLPQEERDSIQEALHLEEITSIFEDWKPE